jgi:N-methylhydantoinase A
MEKEALTILRREGFPAAKQKHERSLAARYKGQSFELQIKTTKGNIAAAFHRAHRARYGYAQERNLVEIVSVRLRSLGLVEKIKRQRVESHASPGFVKPHGSVDTYFAQKKIRAAVYRREKLGAGARLRVPCVVTEYSGTTLVPDGVSASVNRQADLLIELLT